MTKSNYPVRTEKYEKIKCPTRCGLETGKINERKLIKTNLCIFNVMTKCVNFLMLDVLFHYFSDLLNAELLNVACYSEYLLPATQPPAGAILLSSYRATNFKIIYIRETNHDICWIYAVVKSSKSAKLRLSRSFILSLSPSPPYFAVYFLHNSVDMGEYKREKFEIQFNLLNTTKTTRS